MKTCEVSGKEVIGVVLPVHNGQNTIERAVRSVVEQTILEKGYAISLVIVNNNCTDKTSEIVQEYLNTIHKPRLVVLEKEMKTKGIVPALNAGIQVHLSTNNVDFIARMDADDCWYPTKLEQQMSFLEANKSVDILGTQIQLVSPEYYEPISKSNNPISHSDILSALKRGHNPIAHPSVVFRKNILWKTGMYDNLFPMAEDLWLWCKAALNGCVFANTQNVLMDYTSSHNPNYTPISPNLAGHCYSIISNTFGAK